MRILETRLHLGLALCLLKRHEREKPTGYIAFSINGGPDMNLQELKERIRKCRAYIRRELDAKA